MVDFENRKVVYVVKDDVAEVREVNLGTVVGDRVLVLDGIAVGERFIVAGHRNVANGQRIVESEVS